MGFALPCGCIQLPDTADLFSTTPINRTVCLFLGCGCILAVDLPDGSGRIGVQSELTAVALKGAVHPADVYLMPAAGDRHPEIADLFFPEIDIGRKPLMKRAPTR